MEDETAEIELLEQNLNKTHQLSKRMISLLESFDSRLAKLEKSILPLYTATQVLNRRGANIDRTILRMEEVASNHEGVAEEGGLILRGPHPAQLGAYKDALERLNATIAFKSSNADSNTAARLVETGAKKLAQLYTKLVAEVSSGSAPPPGADWTMVPFPSSVLSTLRQLVSIVRSLPLPATHPSHPAAPTVLTALQDAQRGYADMRGTWAQKCLEAQGRRVIERAETIDAIAAGKELGKWVDMMLVVAEDEYDLLTQLAPLSNQYLLSSTYRALLFPMLKLFNAILNSFATLIKKSLPKYTFLALSAYEVLSGLLLRWDEILARMDGPKHSNELKDGLQNLRGLCLRSFPEFLADIKLGAMGRGGELITTGLADFSISTIKYLERLPEVQSAVTAALVKLGDGNWKMGEGVQVGKTAKAEDVPESVVLEHFLYDIVNTTINSLTTLSRTSKRPPFAAIFLLNNVSYLLTSLFLRPVHPALPILLPKPAHDILNSSFRTAKATYFDANFSPLMQALMDDPKEKANKSATKEKLTRFFDLLEEVTDRHKMARVMEDDPEGRERMSEEVVKLVIPSLQRFIQRHRDKDFGKHPSKYIKMSPETVETHLAGIYR